MSSRYAGRFAVAIVLSAIGHAALVAGAWVKVPQTVPEPPPLEARIVSAPPPAPKPVAKPKQAPPRKAGPPRRAAPKPPPAPVIASAGPLALPPEPAPELDVPAAEAPPAAEPAPEAVALAAPPGPGPAPLRSLPKKGRITYTLYLGDDQFTVGRTVQSWEVEEGAYRMGSFSETTGIVDLFRSQRLNYLSQGRITAQGLKPDKFLMSRTRRGKTEEAQALFDWDGGTVTLGKTGERRSASLPATSQDMVSFIYQLGLAPPAPGRVELPITNGSRLETYELEVLPEEEIKTPLGTLRALPVKQLPRPDEERIDVWLATEYRYLPVRIRFYDREGNPAGEQIVSEIRLSEE
ncbi:MAG: DUF3108 domain-containing protein [Betaproteobacteria bacterium]|nr:DUF3108 domain-containing protein [Betaproteobacteria bacterium]